MPLLDWASVQSVPRTIKLDPRRPGHLLFSPVSAIESLRVLPPAVLEPTLLMRRSVASLPSNFGGEHLDVLLRLPAPPKPGTCVGMQLLGGAANATITVVNASSAHMELGGHVAPLPLLSSSALDAEVDDAEGGGMLELRILVDSSIVEAFADGGLATITHRAYSMAPAPQRGAIALINCGDLDVQIDGVEVFQMAKATPPTMQELRARAMANVDDLDRRK